MTVHSRPLPSTEEKRQEAAEPVAQRTSPIVGIFALLFAVPFWLEAARFTRDGWIAFIDWLCARFGIPWQVPPLHWGMMFVLILAVGFGYSYVEIGKQPVKLPKNWRANLLNFHLWRVERRWEAWIVWLVLIVSDVATTYVGARSPDPSGLAIARDIAASGGMLAAYAILLTFIPDRLARYGWRALSGG